MYIHLFIRFCDYLLILGFSLYSTGYRANYRFKNGGNTELHLVSRLRLSGAVPLMSPIHFCCSLVQVYITSFIYPPVIMLGFILPYLLCTTFFIFWRNVWSCFSLYELRQPETTVHITVEIHLTERWLFGSPIVLFGLAPPVNLSRILHK
jgi:hypothetical protein